MNSVQISDKDIREFQLRIIEYINASPIPVEIKRLVLAEIYSKLDQAATNEINAQIKASTDQENTKVENS